MNWLARTAEGEFGPISFDTLSAWARDARLLANDEVREDQPDSLWKPAGDVPDFGLFWRIQFDDGSSSQPIHGETLLASMQSGDFQLDWQVEDVRSGTSYQLVDVACSLLLGQNRELRQLLDDAHVRLSVQSPASLMPTEPSSPTEWQRLVRELDHYKKEDAKLRKFLEDELFRARLREEQFQHSTEKFKADERTFEERINLLSQSRDRMNAELFELREAIRSGQPDSELISLHELALGNLEMGREQTRLQERLSEQDRDLQIARQERDQAENHARESLRRADELVAKERLAAQKARDQFLRLEHKHREMLASYRELSDRLIRMRNENLRAPPPLVEDPIPPPAQPRASSPEDGPRVKTY